MSAHHASRSPFATPPPIGSAYCGRRWQRAKPRVLLSQSPAATAPPSLPPSRRGGRLGQRPGQPRRQGASAPRHRKQYARAAAASTGGGGHAAGASPHQGLPAPPPGIHAKLALFYAAYFATLGTRLPYWPLWMSQVQGLSSADIGLVLGMTQVARTVWSPAIGLLADSLKAPKQMAVLLALACVLANLSLLMSHKIATLLVLCSVTNCLFGAIMPLGESLAVTRLRVGDYGRVRLWGSVGFIVANVLGGQIIHATGAQWVMPIMVAYSVLLAAACMQLPRDRRSTHDTQLSSQSQATTDDELPNKRSAWAEAVALASNVKYIIFLLAVALIQASHATYYSFGTIMLQQAGHSGGVIGMLWGVGVVAEVLLFAEKRLQVALSAWQLLALAGAASVLRWAVMATNPSSSLLIVMQVLHGLTFGACHLGTIKFIQTAVPGSISATANALSGALSDGIFMAGATFVSGHLVTDHGFATYLAMSVMGGIGCVLALLLGRAWDGGPLQMQ